MAQRLIGFRLQRRRLYPAGGAFFGPPYCLDDPEDCCPDDGSGSGTGSGTGMAGDCVHVSCGNCLDSLMPSVYALFIDGIVNGTCAECERQNGWWYPAYVGEDVCIWSTGETDLTTCDDASHGPAVQLVHDDASHAWKLYLDIVGATYACPDDDFQCCGSNTFIIMDDGFGGCVAGSLPFTLTLTPIGCCEDSEPGLCAGDCGLTGPLLMTVSGCECGAGSIDGAFPMSYDGLDGVTGRYYWTADDGVTDPCGETGQIMYHRMFFDPATGCYKLDHSGFCGFVAADTPGGFVHSCDPPDIEWTVTDPLGVNCAGCGSPMTVTVTAP